MLSAAQLCVASPLFVSVVCSAVLFAVGWNGWPGVVGSSGMEFCEELASGMIKQPANAWSNVGFMVAGIGVGMHAAGVAAGRRLPRARNRMTGNPLYPILYATAAALVGPMSLALHASATTWGGKIDILSMFAWASFCVVYAGARLQGLSDTQFVRGFVAVLALLTTVFLASPIPGSGSVLFGVAVTAFGILEAWNWRRHPEVGIDRRWLFATIAIFGTALFIWWMSRTGNPWCDPHSLLQGHAVWHVLNSFAMVTVYVYFCSEEAPGNT